MFILDATTAAIILPSSVQWMLLFTAWSRNHSSYPAIFWRGLTKPSKQNEIRLQSATFNLVRAFKVQLKIYVPCLILATMILLFLNSLNPLQALIVFKIGTIFRTLIILLGYELFSISLVLPLFYSLQFGYFRSFEKKSNLRFKVFEHLLLFSIMALYFLPISEALRALFLCSPFPDWLIKDNFRVCVAAATVPLCALSIMTVLKSTSHGRNLKGLKREQILSYIEFLKDENFDVNLLEGKSISEAENIIEIAKSTGDLDKAEILSKHLVQRLSIDR